MAAFAQFASDLDATTQRLLLRGEKLTELLKQPQYTPMVVEMQVVMIYAGTRGYLDKIKSSEVTRFETELAHELTSKNAELLATIRNDKQLSSKSEDQLKAALEKFVSVFA